MDFYYNVAKSVRLTRLGALAINGTVMTTQLNRLAGDYVASFEFVHPKDIIEAIREQKTPRPATMWTLGNEIRPSDLYCYLGARFGQPNGLQNFLRNDDSDNLVHWEWHLKTSIGYITIAGLNFRTDVWITGDKLPDTEKTEFIRQVKSDFSRYGKEMAHIRKEHLEPWIEFVNPYQRLRRAVKQLIEELDKLNLNPASDALPSLLESEDLSAGGDQWRDRAADYSKAIGLSFGIRAMVPVMAESFVNLLFSSLRCDPFEKTDSFSMEFFASRCTFEFDHSRTTAKVSKDLSKLAILQ
ncbi:hypothetical protein [Paraburkholderia sp. BL6665CI2N2]|uniref:hypothetical protein n=1 Tax=Paraburkholderia sp. BL6665CI2N2 TaxID=1938806 RepID=UPI001066907D|nr:hypothetical protein [Paraburkholderia sp. BL6665CI2N2]